MIGILHDRLSEYIAGKHIAGASVIVRKGGEVMHRECLGYADIANKRPVTEDTVFRMASMTKPVIAMGIMMLIEDGALRLDTPIAEYIPGFAEMKVAKRTVSPTAEDMEAQIKAMEYEPLKRPIIIEDLLRHRSGLGHGPLSFAFGINELKTDVSFDERIQLIVNTPMDFQPGEGTGYSAVTAFDVLGRIIELASGKPLFDFLNDRIFAPLGMTDTRFVSDEAYRARLPRLYARPENELIDTQKPDENTNPFEFAFPCGSGGLYSTLEDYDRFVQMLASGGVYGEKRLLRAETVAAMATACPDDPPMDFPGAAWGLGMSIFQPYSISKRYLARGTFGWSGAFGTHFYIDPVNDVTMVLMVNRSDIGGAGSYVSFGVEEMIFKGLGLKDE